MRISYYWDDSKNVIRFTAHTDSTSAEQARTIVHMMADTTLPDDANLLIDFSRVEERQTVEHVRRLCGHLQLLLIRFTKKIAVVDSRVGEHTLTRLAVLTVQDVRCEAFLMEKDALDWLKNDQDL